MLLLDQIQAIAHAAGTEAMRFYGQSVPVDYKADDSPLTAADRAAHRLICDRLRELTPEIPVLSEESDPAEVADRRQWKKFWLVDPLDGTKEFIKQTGEFTVNIALIVYGRPELGVIHAPATGLTYLAEKSSGAFKQERGGGRQPIRVRKADGRGLRKSNAQRSTSNFQRSEDNQEPGTKDQEQPEAINQEQPEATREALIIVASRDHAGPLVAKLFERFPEAETRSMGSSLKFCLVAEGAADLYLRDVPTMEWDTGAAQCILECAGGEVRELHGPVLAYNKENLRNPSIIAIGDPATLALV